ncbi:MAG TPA: hypothetical protein PLJ21_12675 [Pseudobdellovibrionaceae bacterium]|nr:hypothetical protein [Pseudobdellovibrionaceae bacterium]
MKKYDLIDENTPEKLDEIILKKSIIPLALKKIQNSRRLFFFSLTAALTATMASIIFFNRRQNLNFEPIDNNEFLTFLNDKNSNSLDSDDLIFNDLIYEDNLDLIEELDILENWES